MSVTEDRFRIVASQWSLQIPPGTWLRDALTQLPPIVAPGERGHEYPFKEPENGGD